MDSFQAPAGGVVSPVNDVFYKGGQFVPDTGLFCGSARKAKKHAATPGNWAEVRVMLGYRGYWVERKLAGESRFVALARVPFASQAEAVVYAEAAIAARGEFNRSRGFMPHPTLLQVVD